MIVTEPIELKFGPEEEAKRNEYVYNNLTSLKRSLQDLTENKIISWRKDKEGKPESEKKTFPWRGASNLVIQVISSNIETLLAQVLAAIWEVSPLWAAQLIGDWDDSEHGEEQRNAVESFMSLMGLSKDELDLYRVESVLFEAAIGYGFNAGKLPWVDENMSYCIGMQEGPQFEEREMYRGPRPEVIPFEDFGVNNNATNLENARFKFHKIHLTRYELEERAFLGRFGADGQDKIERIIHSTDKRDRTEYAKDQAAGLIPSNEPIETRWTLYECHYPYLVDFGGKKHRINIIETYHYDTKTSLRAIYNWYPGNQNIFFGARLGYTDRGIYGLGFCEILKMAQQELSAAHNRYADNGTLANTSLFRIDPDAATRVDANFSIYPSAAMPFKKDEFEAIALGREIDTGIDRERQMLELVKYRTGLDSGMSGAGGGIVNPKRGIYSAMGTFAAMQAGNRKSNLRIADFRLIHQEIGSKSLQLYSEMGVGGKAKQFGKDAEWLLKALENIKNGRIRIPVKASTASINREMEKQNDMLMVNLMTQHYNWVGTLLEKVKQVQDPDLQDYAVKAIIGSDFLMRHVLRNYGHDDISRLLPEPNFIKKIKEQQDAAARGNTGAVPGGIGNSGAPVSTIPVQQTDLSQQGGGSPTVLGQQHEAVPSGLSQGIPGVH
jgi:hypothetical protein